MSGMMIWCFHNWILFLVPSSLFTFCHVEEISLSNLHMIDSVNSNRNDAGVYVCCQSRGVYRVFVRGVLVPMEVFEVSQPASPCLRFIRASSCL